ncbi:integrase arm-type DNA-binding domain-containing protein [Tabrizicola sp. J26]|uniref:tyrosine-type recombinase/integrase n=1 Tax=Alitabrizicola rongguiensis TaxID=2909234 RepID=UPI001F19C209|nr:site-specific integrase [Tabrizicola rongguiensis]MCF1707533.1 integrase arm-type DNA-binding domain-containing protein [Tabrizicola rongguiensis]
MPKKARELGPLDIKRMVRLGRDKTEMFSVGGVSGLYLQVLPSGAASWLLRVMVGEKRREIGLGGYPDVTLAAAREKARQARDAIRQGIDPAEERKAARASLVAMQRRELTFSTAIDRCLAGKLDAFRNQKHKAQWRSTLATYAEPYLGKMVVSEITTQDVLRVLEPIWSLKTETASRLRTRIEAVLSWATVAGHRTGDNPARWAGNLKELLPSAAKVAKSSNFPALALDDAARWFADIQARQGTTARALEFLALCAARSGEVRGALWNEIDLAKGIWTIPATRMKMEREHRVALSSAAVRLLGALPMLHGNLLVFPAPRGGELSDMALSMAMKRMHTADMEAGNRGFLDQVSRRPAVPHGLRSTFRDWVAERTSFPGEMAEVALAHRISNVVEAAYRRGDMIERRRAMMEGWSEFLACESGSPGTEERA